MRGFATERCLVSLADISQSSAQATCSIPGTTLSALTRIHDMPSPSEPASASRLERNTSNETYHVSRDTCIVQRYRYIIIVYH